MSKAERSQQQEPRGDGDDRRTLRLIRYQVPSPLLLLALLILPLEVPLPFLLYP